MRPTLSKLRRGAAQRLWSGLLLAGGLAAWGCASSGAHLGASGVAHPAWPRVAVVPFENLSERTDASAVTTRIVTERLAERGGWNIVETAEVDAALEALRIRDSGAIPRDQVVALGQKIGVRYLLTGSVLENNVIRTADGDVPSIGLSLTLVETSAGRVTWRRLKFRTGDDHETLFGWGRVSSAHKLTADLVADLLEDLPHAPADSAASGGGVIQ